MPSDSVAGPSRPALVAYTVGGAELRDRDDAWANAYEVAQDGAVLVRPDGHVAWRSRSACADPAGALRAVMNGVLGLSSHPAPELAGR